MECSSHEQAHAVLYILIIITLTFHNIDSLTLLFRIPELLINNSRTFHQGSKNSDKKSRAIV